MRSRRDPGSRRLLRPRPSSRCWRHRRWSGRRPEAGRPGPPTRPNAPRSPVRPDPGHRVRSTWPDPGCCPSGCAACSSSPPGCPSPASAWPAGATVLRCAGGHRPRMPGDRRGSRLRPRSSASSARRTSRPPASPELVRPVLILPDREGQDDLPPSWLTSWPTPAITTWPGTSRRTSHRSRSGSTRWPGGCGRPTRRPATP